MSTPPPRVRGPIQKEEGVIQQAPRNASRKRQFGAEVHYLFGSYQLAQATTIGYFCGFRMAPDPLTPVLRSSFPMYRSRVLRYVDKQVSGNILHKKRPNETGPCVALLVPPGHHSTRM